MSESQTIERKTVSMPRSPRSLTHKGSIHKLLPIGEFVTDGAIAFRTGDFPHGGKREAWFKAYPDTEKADAARECADRNCPLMISEFPGAGNVQPPAFEAKRLFLDIDAKTPLAVVVTDEDTPDLGFDIRYWLFVKKCGFTIHPRGDERGEGLSRRPYPIHNPAGEVVGLIGPVGIGVRRRRDLLADIA